MYTNFIKEFKIIQRNNSSNSQTYAVYAHMNLLPYYLYTKYGHDTPHYYW